MMVGVLLVLHATVAADCRGVRVLSVQLEVDLRVADSHLAAYTSSGVSINIDDRHSVDVLLGLGLVSGG